MSDSIGSIGALYDLVAAAQDAHAVDGNFKGSLLTMTSQQGLYFAIILLTSNFGAVIVSPTFRRTGIPNYSRWTLAISSKLLPLLLVRLFQGM